MSEPQKPAGAGARAQKCPTCGKPAADPFRPFCSTRCRDVDLHRWLSGQYAIPTTEDTDEDGALPEAGAPPLGGDFDRQ